MTSREAEVMDAEEELQAWGDKPVQQEIELDLKRKRLETREETAVAMEEHYQKSVTSFNTRFAEMTEEQKKKVAAELKEGRESFRKELQEEFSRKCKEQESRFVEKKR